MSARSPVAADALEVGLQPVERLEPAELLQRGLEPQRLVAAEPHAVAQPVGQQLVEVRGQLGEVPAQAVVAQQRVDRVLELGPLLRGQRAQQRLHRGHPVRQLVDDVVERLRAREELAVLGEELVDVRAARLVARQPLREELVEVADHLALRREVLGLHALHRVGQALAQPVEHRAPEAVDQGLEALARVLVDEVVVLEPADPRADVGRERVEACRAASRRSRAASARGRGRAPGSGRRRREPRRRRPPSAAAWLAASASASSRRWTPARSSSTISSSSLRTSASGSDSAPCRRSSSRRSRRRSRRSRRPGRSPRDGSLPAQPALHQPPQRLRDVAVLEHVVGERVDDLVGRQVGQVLRAVPAPVLARRGGRVRSRPGTPMSDRLRCRGSGVRKATGRYAAASASVAVGHARRAAVLVQPALEVEALEQELDGGRDERRLLRRRRSTSNVPSRSTASCEPRDLAHPADVLARRDALAGLDDQAVLERLDHGRQPVERRRGD